MYRLFSSTVLVFFVTTLFAQKNELSLLNGRFSFIFPDSAKNSPRAGNIMSADPNVNDETRIIYDIGDERIVFFAEELYLKSGDSLEERISSETSASYPLVTSKLYDQDSVLCLSRLPSVFDSTKNTILINFLIIKNADNTLSRISVYLNKKAFADKKTFDNIVNQTFATFKKGPKRLLLNERNEHFNILDTKNTVEIKLAKNYIVTRDKKYDFEVLKVRKIVNYGDAENADLIMYFGFHPTFFYNELSLEKNKTPDTDGEFMFQKIKWMNFEDKEKALIVREQMFIDDDIQKDAKIHIAMISNKQQNIDEMGGMVKNILIKYNK